jgi:hypothetical protein
MSDLGGLIASVMAGAGGLAAGGWIGLLLGRRYSDMSWRFWMAGIAALVACSALCALGLAFDLRWVAVGAIGLLGGTFTGLKYGARGGFMPSDGG